MRIKIVYDEGEVTKEDVFEIERFLSRLNINYEWIKLSQNNLVDIGDSDYIIVVGGDRLILRTLLSLPDKSIPIVSLNGRRSKGFLSISGVENLPEVVKEIIRGNYSIENRIRLSAMTNDSTLAPALNELAIFSKYSGKLIRYTLTINDEFIWRDNADGVIIATPTGSTAHALSAGGPIIKDGDVFAIVPVNSLIPTHKPIITSSSNTIIIDDLRPNEDILIIDGQIRHSINTETIVIRKAEYDAKFLRLRIDTSSDFDRRLARRAGSQTVTASLEDLPPSAKLVYKVLEYEGPLTTREIISKTGLPPRTVRYAINLLIDKRLVVKRHFDRDARVSVYSINM